MTRVAEKTGLERTHLYRKLRQLGVDLGARQAQLIFKIPFCWKFSGYNLRLRPGSSVGRAED